MEYSNITTLEMWENMAGITDEMAKQTRLQSQITKLEEEYAALSGDEALANLQERARLYGKMMDSTNELLSSDEYKKAVAAGYIVDGQVVASHAEMLAMGSEMATFLNMYGDQIEDAYEAQQEAIDGYRSVIETYYDREKELLSERKDLYQNYFDSVDQLNEEQERIQNKQDIINQLAAISGGTDGNSQTLRKNLLSQLADLNKEQEQAIREKARDDMISSIDKHIESIDNKIDKLSGYNANALYEIGLGLGFNMTAPAFKNGGLVDFTGPAWVDGSRSHPEAFLDATDTAILARIMDLLVLNLNNANMDNIDFGQEGNASSVVIEEINIHTDELNTQQDFVGAGNALAREFAKIIEERGINVNARK